MDFAQNQQEQAIQHALSRALRSVFADRMLFVTRVLCYDSPVAAARVLLAACFLLLLTALRSLARPARYVFRSPSRVRAPPCPLASRVCRAGSA